MTLRTTRVEGWSLGHSSRFSCWSATPMLSSWRLPSAEKSGSKLLAELVRQRKWARAPLTIVHNRRNFRKFEHSNVRQSLFNTPILHRHAKICSALPPKLLITCLLPCLQHPWRKACRHQHPHPLRQRLRQRPLRWQNHLLRRPRQRQNRGNDPPAQTTRMNHP